jgi:hypothetical protein
VARTASGVVLVLLVAFGFFLIMVHDATADWWPSTIPTRVQFTGRNYDCGHANAHGSTAHLHKLGHTIGGGTIYAHSAAPDAFIVVKASDIVRYCPLNGGL